MRNKMCDKIQYANFFLHAFNIHRSSNWSQTYWIENSAMDAYLTHVTNARELIERIEMDFEFGISEIGLWVHARLASEYDLGVH